MKTTQRKAKIEELKKVLDEFSIETNEKLVKAREKRDKILEED